MLRGTFVAHSHLCAHHFSCALRVRRGKECFTARPADVAVINYGRGSATRRRGDLEWKRRGEGGKGTENEMRKEREEASEWGKGDVNLASAVMAWPHSGLYNPIWKWNFRRIARNNCTLCYRPGIWIKNKDLTRANCIYTRYTIQTTNSLDCLLLL